MKRRLPPHLIASLRRRAPRHPPGPEAHLRTTLVRIVKDVHEHIRAGVRLVAPGLHMRRDAVRDVALRSVLDDAKRRGQRLLHTVKPAIAAAAARAAHSAAKQTQQALKSGIIAAPLDRAHDLASRVFDGTSALIDDAADRADTVVGEWLDLDPDRSERAEDIDALDDMLASDLEGNLGRTVQLVTLAFGIGFAGMIADAQGDAGVSTYMWLTANDSAVRPAHRALDQEVADWDDPPLKASVSDNEEDDHPGDDYGCRCVASPLTPTESAMLT